MSIVSYCATTRSEFSERTITGAERRPMGGRPGGRAAPIRVRLINQFEIARHPRAVERREPGNIDPEAGEPPGVGIGFQP
jgi:hypothetical protein